MTSLTAPRSEVQTTLETQLTEGAAILAALRGQPEHRNQGQALTDWKMWRDRTSHVLRRYFSDGSVADRFERTSGSMNVGMSKAEFAEAQLDPKLVELESIYRRLDLFDEPSSRKTPTAAPAPRESPQTAADGGSVFIVHGRDVRLEEVARFLERECSSEVMILKEQASQGLTLIEKFERYAGAAVFSVILFTGDDEGRLVGTDDLRPRPRQNVVLELGFFLGALGRDRIAVLFDEGIELPSDFSGVSYIPFDEHGGWREKLRIELRSAEIALK
jgi:predicted nucleotide-binding protein